MSKQIIKEPQKDMELHQAQLEIRHLHDTISVLRKELENHQFAATRDVQMVSAENANNLKQIIETHHK